MAEKGTGEERVKGLDPENTPHSTVLESEFPGVILILSILSYKTSPDPEARLLG